MKKNIVRVLTIIALIPVLLFSCKDEDEDMGNRSNPLIENLSITPNSSLTFGDQVVITANLSDEVFLRSYTAKFSNAQGDILEEVQMLTGTSFDVNSKITIPLPKNATPGDVIFSLILKNSAKLTTLKEITLSNVQVPDFQNLYLALENKVYTLTKNGSVYETEDFFPAGAKGKIYSDPEKTGLYWGTTNGEISVMGSGDISIGKMEEAYFKVSFDPTSFVLTIGGTENWTAIEETFYIYGEISGNWQDGDIVTQLNSTKMKGYQSGNRKFWTWTPPGLDESDPNSGKPGEDMWGSIASGNFRFKKANQEEYIVFSNGRITTTTTNDKSKSFYTSAGGAFTIKLYYDGQTYNMVSLETTDRSLDYTNDAILINGTPKPEAINFAGTLLPLKSGKLYEYEGVVDLTRGQSITATGTNLSTNVSDPDVFSGKGNSTWTMIGVSGKWLIRIDPFASKLYACEQGGFPNSIYLDGWSWAKFEDDPSISWVADKRLCLQRTDPTKSIYEATFYNFGWGGDFSLWLLPSSNENYSHSNISNRFFDGIIAASGTKAGIMFGNGSGYMKISVDLKDGLTYNTSIFDPDSQGGSAYMITPVNNKKFTINYTSVAAP